MTDPLSSPEDTNATRGPNKGTRGGRPGWAVVVGIVLAIALLALIVLLHLSGVIGPGSH
jgi:hypothetical protein